MQTSHLNKQRRRDMGAAPVEPQRVLEVELSQPLPVLAVVDPCTGRAYRQVLLLVRLYAQPLGLLELQLPTAELHACVLAQHIWQALSADIKQYLRAHGLPMVDALPTRGLPPQPNRSNHDDTPPFVSIVVPTRERPAQLTRCLDALDRLDYPCYEIIVVDNAPCTDVTAALVCATPGVRYVREDRPGVDWARNRGMAEAHGTIIACTDDDVRVDRHWLTALVRAFTVAPDVACVTGLTMPAELDTPAQCWFEQFGGFGKGFEQRVFDLDTQRVPHALYPYAAGSFGSSANMAIRANVLRDIGGFDPALGAGSKAAAGGDIDLFFRVLMHGQRLVYEPAALVHHTHRRSYSALRQQIYNYGVGLTAFLTKCVWDDPRRCFDIAWRLPTGIWYTLHPYSTKNRKKQADYPRALTWLELRGMVYGPWAYFLSRRQVRRLRQQAGQIDSQALWDGGCV